MPTLTNSLDIFTSFTLSNKPIQEVIHMLDFQPFFKGKRFFCHTVGFSINQTSSEKGSNEFAPEEQKVELIPTDKGGKNIFQRVGSLLKAGISFIS